jgi:transcription elongation regulator 1
LKKKRKEKPVPTKAATTKGNDTSNSELSEEDKAKQKSKPISSTAVPGSPWCVVWTKDKRVFFYNPTEKISLWERPAMLIGRIDVDRMVREPPQQTPSQQQQAAETETKKAKSDSTTTATTPEQQPPVKKLKSTHLEDEDGTGSSSEGGSSRSRSQSPAPNTNGINKQQIAEEFLQKDKLIPASKEAALEAEHKAAQVRLALPLEQRLSQFREMLIEKGVSAYSTWEKELQKIVFDPRYLLLTSKERKQCFEKYVRERANEESKERASAASARRQKFRELLKEAQVSIKTLYADFVLTKYARDERMRAIEKSKERESLFNEYIAELKQLEKEEKYQEREKQKKKFIELLKDVKPPLHRNSSWTETKRSIDHDSRYRAIDSSSRREDYFRDYCKYLDEKKEDKDGKHGHKHHRKDKKDKDKKRDKNKSKNNNESESENDNIKKSVDDIGVEMKEEKDDDKEEGEEKDEAMNTSDENEQNSEEKRKQKVILFSIINSFILSGKFLFIII